MRGRLGPAAEEANGWAEAAEAAEVVVVVMVSDTVVPPSRRVTVIVCVPPGDFMIFKSMPEPAI